MPSVCIIEALRGTNSVVECDLAKVEVAGSNPVSRSIIFRQLIGPESAIPLTSTIPDCICIPSATPFRRLQKNARDGEL